MSWVIYIMHRERGGESHLRTREEGEELVSRGRKEEKKKKRLNEKMLLGTMLDLIDNSTGEMTA